MKRFVYIMIMAMVMTGVASVFSDEAIAVSNCNGNDCLCGADNECLGYVGWVGATIGSTRCGEGTCSGTVNGAFCASGFCALRCSTSGNDCGAQNDACRIPICTQGGLCGASRSGRDNIGCSDGNPCTSGDYCMSGSCVAGQSTDYCDGTSLMVGETDQNDPNICSYTRMLCLAPLGQCATCEKPVGGNASCRSYAKNACGGCTTLSVAASSYGTGEPYPSAYSGPQLGDPCYISHDADDLCGIGKWQCNSADQSKNTIACLPDSSTPAADTSCAYYIGCYTPGKCSQFQCAGLVTHAAASACDDGNPVTLGTTCVLSDGSSYHQPANILTCTNPTSCSECNKLQGLNGAPPVADTGGGSPPESGSCNDSDNQCPMGYVCNRSTGSCEEYGTCHPSTGEGCTCVSGVTAPPANCSLPDSCGTCIERGDPDFGAIGVCMAKLGNPCDDGKTCTDDICPSNGTCQNTVTGSSCLIDGVCYADGEQNPVNPCQKCDATVSKTAWTNISNDSPCDDGNKCNGVSSCQNGTCTQTTAPVACASPDACHDVGQCNTSTGVCTNPAKPDGTSCDNATRCDGRETCTAGVCTAGVPINCGVPNEECYEARTCDAVNGSCSVLRLKPNKCFIDNQCINAGTQNPLNNCQECNPSRTAFAWSNKANNTSCDDDTVCNGRETCQNGTCSSGTPVTCEAQDSCHSVGTCNSLTGQCTNPAKTDGTSCDDGDKCNGVSACTSGSCTQTTAPVTCQALDACHDAGQCNSSTGQCTNPAKADNTPCDDNTVCNGRETCQAGVCSSGTPLSRDDKDSCTADSCDPINGTVHTRITQCLGGDGCCAPGCNANNDSDCSQRCGNGSVEGNETCDGNCPTTCDDRASCTTDTMTGAPENCNVLCSHSPINSCISGDGCCPLAGVIQLCTRAKDSDCPIRCQNGVVEEGEECETDADCARSKKPGFSCKSCVCEPPAPKVTDITGLKFSGISRPPQEITEVVRLKSESLPEDFTETILRNSCSGKSLGNLRAEDQKKFDELNEKIRATGISGVIACIRGQDCSIDCAVSRAAELSDSSRMLWTSEGVAAGEASVLSYMVVMEEGMAILPPGANKIKLVTWPIRVMPPDVQVPKDATVPWKALILPDLTSSPELSAELSEAIPIGDAVMSITGSEMPVQFAGDSVILADKIRYSTSVVRPQTTKATKQAASSRGSIGDVIHNMQIKLESFGSFTAVEGFPEYDGKLEDLYPENQWNEKETLAVLEKCAKEKGSIIGCEMPSGAVKKHLFNKFLLVQTVFNDDKDTVAAEPKVLPFAVINLDPAYVGGGSGGCGKSCSVGGAAANMDSIVPAICVFAFSVGGIVFGRFRRRNR